MKLVHLLERDESAVLCYGLDEIYHLFLKIFKHLYFKIKYFIYTFPIITVMILLTNFTFVEIFRREFFFFSRF